MTMNRAQQNGLDLHQLDNYNMSSRRSSRRDARPGKYIFLYHGMAANGSLHVFALFQPNRDTKLFLVDPATRRQPLSRLSDLYTTLLQKKQQSFGTSTSLSYPSSMDFSHSYHSTDLTALKAISRELGVLEGQSFIVVISSSKDQFYFERSVAKLSKFPIFSMPQTKGPHSLDVFPWQSHVGQKLLSRYLGLGTWLDRMASLADYYDVPIGHIEGDQPLLLADLSFARRLVQQDVVLWWSPGDWPDLGGIENDRRPVESFPKTDFQTSGIFSNVCLEITVRNLAVDAVLQSVLVNGRKWRDDRIRLSLPHDQRLFEGRNRAKYHFG